MRFAVFIHDKKSATEEFVGLARIDTEAEDAEAACERAAGLHSQFSRANFTVEDVALCAQLLDPPPITGARIRARLF